jgi:hypothetical protein
MMLPSGGDRRHSSRGILKSFEQLLRNTLSTLTETFGGEPKALPTQEVVDNEEVRSNQNTSAANAGQGGEIFGHLAGT